MNNVERRKNIKIESFYRQLKTVVKKESIPSWMETPNKTFDNRTPKQIINNGEIDLLFEMIARMSGQ